MNLNVHSHGTNEKEMNHSTTDKENKEITAMVTDELVNTIFSFRIIEIVKDTFNV